MHEICFQPTSIAVLMGLMITLLLAVPRHTLDCDICDATGSALGNPHRPGDLPDPNDCDAFLAWADWAFDCATVARRLLHAYNTAEDTYTVTTRNTIATRPPPSDAHPQPRRADFTGISTSARTSWSRTSTLPNPSYVYDNYNNWIGFAYNNTVSNVDLASAGVGSTRYETKTNYITVAGAELNTNQGSMTYNRRNDHGHVFHEHNTSGRQFAVQYSFSTGDIPAQMSKEG